jgi:hypothetical protein
MTDYDPRIAAVLDRLIPPLANERIDWDALVGEAGETRRRRVPWAARLLVTSRQRRIAVLAAAVLATALVALPTLAVSDWWFLGPGAPKSTSEVTVVASGTSAGTDWTMTAYVSEDKGVCVALTPDVGEGDMGAASCGAGIRGESSRAASGVRSERHWIGYVYFRLGLFEFPDFLFGPIAEGVEEVDVALSNGQTVQAATIDGPDALSAPLDFYVAELPGGVSVESVVARDRADTVLERRSLRVAVIEGGRVRVPRLTPRQGGG